MTSSISRRQALAAALGAAALSPSIAGTATAAGSPARVGGARPREETRTLDELFEMRWRTVESSSYTPGVTTPRRRTACGLAS
jgi:hypothetical protein